MTYCCGLLVEEGLALIADTRTNAGVDNISVFRKLHVFATPGERVLVLATAGNLSVTQSAISLLQEGVLNPRTGERETLQAATSMFHAAQLVGEALRRVTDEVKAPLDAAGVDYGATVLLGGQISGAPLTLYMVYGVGNFIECGPDAPYLQIGEPKYGKPVLDRFVAFDTPVVEALKAGLISFDATMRSNLAVGMPLDLVIIRRDSLVIDLAHRIDPEEAYFRDLSRSWNEALRSAAAAIPPPPYAPAADPQQT
jgi:putative proteasome-type protease